MKTPDAFTDLVVSRRVLQGDDTDPVSRAARDRLLAEFERADALVREQRALQARVKAIGLELMQAHASASALADLLWQAHGTDPKILNAIAEYAATKGND